MKLLPNTAARSKVAFLMLALWLFAQGSGLANACLLEASATTFHGAKAGSLERAHPPAELPGHTGGIAHHHHDEDGDTSKAPCLKACDDGSQALQKQHTGLDPGNPGLAPLVALLWTTAAPAASAPRRFADPQPLLSDPPLRVLYSRWAL